MCPEEREVNDLNTSFENDEIDGAVGGSVQAIWCGSECVGGSVEGV